MTGIITLAILVVAVLIGIAAYYHILLFQKNEKEKAAEEELRSELAARRQRNVNSIQIIARAVVDGQVSLTEASIRIHTLAQSMKLSTESLDGLSVFRQVAEATSHIPILDRWRALPKKEKIAFDLERVKIEEKFQDFAQSAAKKVAEGELSLAEESG